MKKIFLGKVIKDKLELEERDLFKQLIAKLNNKLVFLTLDTFRSNRSLEQNKYYFGVVIKILSDELGYELDEMHELLKILFNHELKYLKDVEYAIPKSTAGLTTIEFMEYLERIKRWAVQEFQIVIPDPNQIEL